MSDLMLYCILSVPISIGLIMIIALRVQFFDFLKKRWFENLFSLAAAALVFIITNEKKGGKIASALLVLLVAWFIARILGLILSNIKCKPVVVIIEIILCVLLAFFAFTREYVKHHQKPIKYYDKYGKSYYSKEKRDEANFIHDMYGAAYNK